MNKKEIIEKLKQIKSEEGAYGMSELENWTDESGFIISTVDELGGSEGDGENHYVVLEIKQGEEKAFYLCPGYYASHDGRYLEPENAYEVVSKEKMITVWVDAATGEES